MSPYHAAKYPQHNLPDAPYPLVFPPHTPPYDARGRQQHFIESAQQRKARIEFLKKREWARRVAEWIRETSARQDVMSFGCTGSLAASSPIADHSHVPRFIPSPSSHSLSSTEEEEEPYIIYSSSPSSSMSSLSDDFTTSPAPPAHQPKGTHTISHTIPPMLPCQRTHHRRRNSASLVAPRRRLSLSSIYEVPEED